MTQNSVCPQLTFASYDALSPCVIELRVAGITTVVEPITAASTTAALPGLFSSTALVTPTAYRR